MSKVERNRVLKRVLFSCFVIVFFLLTVFGMSYTATSVYADTSIETTDPLDDLDGAIIGGEEFSIDDYPWNVNSQPQMIYFAEVGYSLYANTDDDYALYIYVYNPSGLVFDDSQYNKIEMGFGDTNVTYDKYTLELLSYSTAAGYEGLFYKFRVYLSDSQKSTALRLLSQNSRVYTIVSMELSVGGEITDYVVGFNGDTKQGAIYTYTGYTLGYGSSHATESTLAYTVEGFSRYLVLDVEQTVYRPEGDYYDGEQSQLNSCWFTVPTEYIEEYGEITKVKYEWYEYITKPILVTENSSIYSKLYGLHGSDVSNLSNFYYVVSAHGNTDSSWFHRECDVELYTNANFSGTYTTWTSGGLLSLNDYTTSSSNFAAVFYTGGESYDGYSVSGDDVLAQLVLNSQYLGDTSIVGKYASTLFEDFVQTGRTLGYNLAESEGELEIYWNTTTKSQWWQRVFGGYDVDTTYDSVEALYTVSESDLTGTDEEIAARLYISEDDVDALKTRYKTAAANDETLVLFRYGSTDYYSRKVTQSYSTLSGSESDMASDILKQWKNKTYSGYVSQQTVFLNFDIISLTFTDENSVSTEIPVVMSPQDVVSGVTSPLDEDYHTGSCSSIDWSTIIMILALLVLLILMVIFWPIFSLVFKVVIWVICLPFKVIAAMVKASKKRRQKKKERNYNGEQSEAKKVAKHANYHTTQRRSTRKATITPRASKSVKVNHKKGK